jgi:hypothetical protein
MEADVIVVGAGPAGLFAALELAGDKRVLLVDEGRDVAERKCPMRSTGACQQCMPCGIMSGVGGAGTYSDGILNLRLDFKGVLDWVSGSESRGLIRQVDDVFLGFGAPGRLYGTCQESVSALQARAKSAGIVFQPMLQRHMGTENAVRIVKNFSSRLKKSGVRFMLKTRVEDIIVKNGACTGVKTSRGSLKSKSVVLAPGRIGAPWVDGLCAKYGIASSFRPIDAGVRVEVPSRVMDSVIGVNRDPKFHITTSLYRDFVRTFCTNHQGYVVEEHYKKFVGVNGHSMAKRKSANTNFAFLVKIALTEPVEDTLKYGMSIAELATTIGGGRPVIQRLGDLLAGRRSHPHDIRHNKVHNTLGNVTPGDVSMALPHRFVVDILDGLEKLDRVIPGVYLHSTLLYAPEIKLYSVKIKVDRKLETNVRNLFAAGDGCGLSRDIVTASATGILAGRGILEK